MLDAKKRIKIIADLPPVTTNNKKRKMVLVECICGVQKPMSYDTYKTNISCGCYRLERVAKSAYRHGMKGTRPLRIWNAMKSRCNTKTNDEYKHYGGRGIKIEWNDFNEFWADMSATYSDNMTIERIDVNGNYCKSNCKWITLKEQLRNTTKTLFIEHKGTRYKFVEFLEKYNLPRRFFYYHIFQRKSDVNTALQLYGACI